MNKSRWLDVHAKLIQDLLDEGKTLNFIADHLGVHRNQVARVVGRNGLDIYRAFDENIHSKPQEFTEWDFEDEIDTWLKDAFEGTDVTLPQPRGLLDTFTLELYRYIQDTYGGVRNLLRIKAKHTENFFYKVCSKCSARLQVIHFSNHSGNVTSLSSACRKCNYAGKSPLALRSSEARRRAYVKELPSDWGQQEYLKTTQLFGEVCILTGEGEEIDYDHFIPVSIGHAGTVLGNMYPLSSSLNRRKSDANPFEWFEANRQRFELDQSRFDSLVAKLAEQNGLTPEEFREYTDWCFANPRNLTQIKRDNARYGYRVTSVEIWREATGRSSEPGNRLNDAV